MPPFFEKFLSLNLSDQKGLHDEAAGACTARTARPRARRRAAVDSDYVPAARGTIEIFQSFEESDSRSGAFGISVVLHSGILLILIVLPLIFTSSLKVNYNDVALIAPPLEKPVEPVETIAPPPRPDPPREPRIPIQPLVTPPPAVNEVRKVEREPKTEIPIPKPPKAVEPAAPASVPVTPRRLAEPEASIAPPRLGVQTGVFSKTDTAAVMAPARDIQTGGFGDPNGVPARNSTHAPDIAVGGSFASAAQGGVPGGNSSRASGTAVGGGFASAAPSSYQATAAGTVRQGGFDAAPEAAPRAAPKKIDAGPPDKPVEIVYKPKPDYTDEARRLRVEGEVLVHVLFKATGEISVLDIVRGLGHGLDESAMRAAGQIRFKPAMRAGQSMDSTATVHIIFQLAF